MGLSIRFLIGLGEPTQPRSVDVELEARLASALGGPGAYRYPELTITEHRLTQRERRARTILGDAYACGAFFKGQGVWQGAREDSLMFETILDIVPSAIGRRQDAEEAARDVARRLANVLGQDAIGLVFTPVDFELVGVDRAG